MLNLNTKLRMLEENGKTIRVGIVGAGQMGKGLVSQIKCMHGMKTVILANRTLQKAVDAYKLANIPEENITIAKNSAEAQQAIINGFFAGCTGCARSKGQCKRYMRYSVFKKRRRCFKLLQNCGICGRAGSRSVRDRIHGYASNSPPNAIPENRQRS